MFKKLLPFITQEIYLPSRYTNVNLEKQNITDTCHFHGFKVGSYCITFNITIHEIPVYPRSCRIRRIDKSLSQVICMFTITTGE